MIWLVSYKSPDLKFGMWLFLCAIKILAQAWLFVFVILFWAATFLLLMYRHQHIHSAILIQFWPIISTYILRCIHIAHLLQQQRHNSKLVIFQEKHLKVLKCYTFLWVQQRHNCSPAAGFANSVMTLYLLKAHLQTFLSIPITQKCQILSCGTLVANERYIGLPQTE